MFSYRLACKPPQTWAEESFTQAPLGDRRRAQRAAMVGQAMAQQPGAPIPDLFDTPYDIKAAYTLFDRPESTPDRLQAPHRVAVRASMHQAGQTYLLLADTSECSWSGNQPIAGLGPIGHGTAGLQGFLLHSVLAVRWPAGPPSSPTRPPLEMLGLADQIYYVRPPRPAKGRGQSRARQERPRESDLWPTHCQRLGPAPQAVRWEEVCDRGADLYEFLTQCRTQGHGFVVRASQDRLLEAADGSEAPDSLFTVARRAPVLGHFELELRERKQQPARTATLAVAAATVRLRSPQRPGHGPGFLPAVACTVVRVCEVNAPEGVNEPLEWILLTDAVVECFEQGLEVALKYNARWLIEEFHKGLKTGLGAERLQLETAARLFAAIAIMSLVALRLIDLREVLRLEPEASADTAGVLSPLELKVLRARLKRPIRTVREMALAIGRLGGHMNRKADGLPGWQTLWRGMKKLRLLVQGVLLTKELSQFG